MVVRNTIWHHCVTLVVWCDWLTHIRTAGDSVGGCLAVIAGALNRHPNHKNSSRLELKMARIKYLWSSEELIAEGKRHRDTKQVLLDLVWRSTDQEVIHDLTLARRT